MKNILKHLLFKDNNFSWRKGLTALVAFIFGFSTIGFHFGLKELPKSYQAIITLVFTFYFTKEIYEGLKLNLSKKKQ